MSFDTLKTNLEKRGYTVSVFATAAEATDYLDGKISGKTVGFGGSVTLDQMGAMLTSYILDQMPAAERLSTKDKMSAMKMVMDIHALKQKVVEEATPIDAVDVESQVKDLSVDALKALIQKTKVIDNENDEKEEMIKALDNESALSNDDLHYLRSLPVEELKKLVDEQQDLQFTQTEEMQVIPNPTSNRQKLTPIDEDDVVDGDDVTGS